jgi:hypothetical protein
MATLNNQKVKYIDAIGQLQQSQQNVTANDFNYPEVDELFRLMTK